MIRVLLLLGMLAAPLTAQTLDSARIYTSTHTDSVARWYTRTVVDTVWAPAPTPTPTPAPAPASPIAYGAFDALGRTYSAPLSLSTVDPDAGSILSALSKARSLGVKVFLNLTGGKHTNYTTANGAGVQIFDWGKWKAKMDSYNTPTIRDAIAKGVADGVIVGESVMDEPQHSSWGGVMTKQKVDSMCGYVARLFPTLPVGVVHRWDRFDTVHSYRTCGFILSIYLASAGNVTTWRDNGLAYTRRDGIAIAFGYNTLNGGTQDKDGTWDCAAQGGTKGQQAPDCQMTAQQVKDWGLVLGPASCAFVMWRYDDAFMSRSGNPAAFAVVRDSLAKLTAPACRRP